MVPMLLILYAPSKQSTANQGLFTFEGGQEEEEEEEGKEEERVVVESSARPRPLRLYCNIVVPRRDQ